MNVKLQERSEAEYKKLLKELQNMEYENKRSEALTGILHFLESELSFEEIATDVVKIVGEFLNVANVAIFTWNTEHTNVKTIAEWMPEGGTPFFAIAKQSTFTKYIIKFNGTLEFDTKSKIDKDETDKNEVKALLANKGIHALISQPVVVNGSQLMFSFATIFFHLCLQSINTLADYH